MSRPRTSLPHAALFAVVAALTTWITLLTWRDFAVRYGEFLGPLLTLGLCLTLLGALLRWLRFPVLAVPLVQVLISLLVIVAMFGNRNGAGHLPTPGGIRGTIDAFADAINSAGQYAAPIPMGVPTVAPLLLACGLGAIILVDLLAAGFGRVPLSGLVLLAVYTLPVTVWGNSISWLIFVIASAGFLLMLFLREDERFSQWGRQITSDPRESDPGGFGVRTGSARGNALAIGSAATAAAVLLPVLIPTLDLTLLGNGNGPGGGDDVSIINPITDLRRDLKQGRDLDLLTVKTDQQDPGYLRYAVLTNFNGNEWTSGNRSIPDDQSADGHTLPDPEGVDASVARTGYSAEYHTTGAFDSIWLPVPTPATAVTAPGTWKYDVSTMDFISDGTNADDLQYTADGVDLNFTQEELVSAGTAPAALLAAYTKLPGDVPDIARDLAFQITDGKAPGFAQAVALQDWFRGAGGFTYSLDIPNGNGSDDLASFLSDGPDGRTGYCEQFASAMAVMARVVGIPARVAVGFLHPDQVGEDSYVYSSYDLHAWPELYFQGVGWVRFEPTPGGRTGSAPSYTLGQLPDPTTTELPSAAATASDEPSRGSEAASPSASRNTDAAGAGSGGQFPWLIVMLSLLGLALLAALAMVPRTLRRVRRDARWRTGTAEAAWAELRDTSVDLGKAWPRGRSPRATANIVAEQFAAAGDVARPVHGRDTNPEASDALDRLVRAVEIERYAPRALEASADELRAEVLVCVEALRNGVSARTRRRADWLPRSLGRRMPRGGGDQMGEVDPATRDEYEHAGR